LKERSHEGRERALGGIALETIALDGISRGNKGTYLVIVCAAGGTWGRQDLEMADMGKMALGRHDQIRQWSSEQL
jgi:formylmethanofuran dehydrogenase subunit E